MAFDNVNKVTWNEMTGDLKTVFNVTSNNITLEVSERSAEDKRLSDLIDAEAKKRAEEFDKLKDVKVGSAIGSAIAKAKDGQIIKINQSKLELEPDDNFRCMRFVDSIPEKNAEFSVAPSAYSSYSLDVEKEYIANLQDDRMYKWNGSSYVSIGRVHDILPNKIWLYNPRTNHFEFYNYWNKYDRIVTYKTGYNPPVIIPKVTKWKPYDHGPNGNTLQNGEYTVVGEFDFTYRVYQMPSDGILCCYGTGRWNSPRTIYKAINKGWNSSKTEAWWELNNTYFQIFPGYYADPDGSHLGKDCTCQIQVQKGDQILIRSQEIPCPAKLYMVVNSSWYIIMEG